MCIRDSNKSTDHEAPRSVKPCSQQQFDHQGERNSRKDQQQTISCAAIDSLIDNDESSQQFLSENEYRVRT